MGKFIFAILVLFSMSNSFAGSLPYCVDSGHGLGFGFQLCVNSNFSAIGEATEISMRQCAGGSTLNAFYQACLNANFKKLAKAYPSLSIEECNNYFDQNVGPGYMYCVNTNFQKFKKFIR